MFSRSPQASAGAEIAVNLLFNPRDFALVIFSFP